MTTASVTLSCRARAACARLGIAEPVAKRARAGGVATHETPRFLVVMGDLPDGRAVRMECSPARPEYVSSLGLA